MQQCKVPDHNTCELKDLDTIFIATNVQMLRRSKNDRNPDRSLVRFEFLEIVIRVAVQVRTLLHPPSCAAPELTDSRGAAEVQKEQSGPDCCARR